MRLKTLVLCCSLVAAALLSGCAATDDAASPDSGIPGSAASDADVATTPTHAVVRITEDWTIPPPSDSDGTILTQHGSEWRIALIDLASGEERSVLATDSASVYAGFSLTALSPDGTRIAFAIPDSPTGTFSRRFSYRAYRAYVIDLATNTSTPLPVGLVRSLGWDGDDIIYTAWREPRNDIAGDAAAPMNSIGRIGADGVTVLTSATPLPDTGDPAASMMQLDYLGAHDGDLYFVGRNDWMFGGWGRQTQQVWTLRDGASVPELFATLDDSGGFPFNDTEAEPSESLLNVADDAYAQFLGNGLFPTLAYRWGVTERREVVHVDEHVIVNSAEMLQPWRSFETTRVEPIPGVPLGLPVYDAELESFLDQRRLAPPTVAEEGLWVCETDTRTGQTAPLALVHRAKMAGEVLGYVGTERNVVYATGNSDFSQPKERAVMLWERATGESRELLRLTPEHAGGRTRIEYLGAASLPE